MREIKFRGKRVDNGEWVCGYYYFDTQRQRHMIWTHEQYGEGLCDSVYEVDPETVGQYTGLKDIFDKEIYEGDLLKAKKTSFNWFSRVVEFKDGGFGYFDGAKYWNPLNKFLKKYGFTVIGNIYDNPELLLDKDCLMPACDCPNRTDWPCGKRRTCSRYIPLPLTEEEKIIYGVR